MLRLNGCRSDPPLAMAVSIGLVSVRFYFAPMSDKFVKWSAPPLLNNWFAPQETMTFSSLPKVPFPSLPTDCFDQKSRVVFRKTSTNILKWHKRLDKADSLYPRRVTGQLTGHNT